MLVFALPTFRPFGSQILIAGLFALSLDLVLGYARIVAGVTRRFRPRCVHGGTARAASGVATAVHDLVAAAAVAADRLASLLIVRGQDLARPHDGRWVSG